MIKNEKIFTSVSNLLRDLTIGSYCKLANFRRFYEISNEALYEHRIITFVHYNYRYDLNEHA
jgi:hypothetical protein